MKRSFLIIGIATENDLFVSSLQATLESEYDEKKATEIIEEHMKCKVDRVLVISDAVGKFAPAIVSNDYIPKDDDEE